MHACIMTDKTGNLGSHDQTRGCCLDYVRIKENVRLDIALGYICDECRLEIRENIGEDYLSCFEEINSMNWLGEMDEKGKPARTLKKFFRIDLDKDTGFYKTRRERIVEFLSQLPEKLITLSITTLTAGIIGFIIGLFLGK